MIYTKRQHTRNIANVQADIARLNRIIDATNVAYDAIMLRDNDDVHPFIMEYLERKFDESHDLRLTPWR